jgi:hypothetical protein
MMRASKTYLPMAVVILTAPLLTGCGLLRHSPGPAGKSETFAGSPGERPGTVPATSPAAPSTAPAATPAAAVDQFATLYINWTYSTISGVQARLAGLAVGEARANELQARAQTSRDSLLRRGRIYNTGSVVAVVRSSLPGSAQWVVITREQTGGGQEYQGGAPAFHVTLAGVRRVSGGWAVSTWLPQV